MYCTNCGEEFLKEKEIYPAQEKNKVIYGNETTMSVAHAASEFCITCSSNAELSEGSPGAAAEELKKDLRTAIPQDFKNTSYLKNAGFYGLQIAVLSFIFISWLSNGILTQSMPALTDTIASATGVPFTDFIHFTDMIALFHGAGFLMSAGALETVLSFQTGLFLPVILLIGLTFLVSWLYALHNKTEQVPSWMLSVSAGFFYAVFLFSMLHFGARSTLLMDTSMQISYHSFSASLLFFFIIGGTVFAGLEFDKGWKSVVQSSMNIHAFLPAGLFAFLSFFLVSMIYIFISSVYFVGTFSQNLAVTGGSFLQTIMLSLQVSAMTLPLIHLQTFQLAMTDIFTGGENVESFWLFSTSGMENLSLGMAAGGLSVPVLLQAGVLIPVAVLAFTGYHIKKLYGEKSLSPILITAGVYTVLTLLWSYYFSTEILINEVTIGLSLSIFISAAAVFLFSALIMFIAGRMKKYTVTE